MATMEKPKPKQKKKKIKYKSEEEEYINDGKENLNIEVNNEKMKSSIDKTEAHHESSEDQVMGVIEEVTIQTGEATINKWDIENVVEATESESYSTEELTAATQSCKEISEALSKIKQALPASEESQVADIKYITTEKSKSSVMSYRDLSSAIDELKLSDVKPKEICRPKIPEVIPFSFEEIQDIFGTKELTAARQYALDFENSDIQAPVSTHPLYEALTEYQRARSQQILNKNEITSLITICNDKQNVIWHIKNSVKKAGGRCADGCYVDAAYSYQDATLERNLLSEFHKSLCTLREKATETHSLHSHDENMNKIQVEEILWMSSISGVDSMRESLRILFWVLRTSGWGHDRDLRRQLRRWCCSLATVLLKVDDSLQNILFLLHHILRVSQGIKWSFFLIQCHIKSVNDISKALSILETVLFPSNKPQLEENRPRVRVSECQEGDSLEVIVASEATDESLWTVVDSDGEGADLDAVGGQSNGQLSETDLLGLIRQIPFEKIFQELMVVRNDGNEFIFCGGNLNGGPILRVFASVRMLLTIIRSGLLTYKKYQELTKELCRLAQHSVMYCTDLWEVANSNCEANLIERLSLEYNSVFLAGWSTIECAGSRDIFTMFLSEMPFRMITIDTIRKAYKNIVDQLIVSESVWCYYTMVCISNMAIVRSEEDFACEVIKYLYNIGFTSDFADFGSGDWARTLCGAALHSKPHLIGLLLDETSTIAHPNWLSALPLASWKPTSGELICLLHTWRQKSPHLIPYLLKAMDWSKEGSLDINTHRAAAVFLASIAQQIVLPKGQYPEWIWECIAPLKLHCYDWRLDKSSFPGAETITELDLTGKCHASSIVAILSTSWGHSVPLIFIHTAPLLIKLANAGRYAEVIHALYYVVPILAECPETIEQCKVFKELLIILTRTEKSYAKMATRLVIGDYAGPVIKLLVSMIQAQLKHYAVFGVQSPRSILMVWVHWLTSVEGWQSDWIHIHLLDIALGSCFLHHDAISQAASHFGSFLQNSLSGKSPNSPSGLSSWLWSSNSFKGLVQCTVEAPYVWHATLWTEHALAERGTGLWERLVEKLTNHKEGTKVNIDKTLKSVGCSDNSSILVIYRCLQYATSMSLSHPLYSLVWQLFFYLYLDISFLKIPNPKPVGHLFFDGLVNSRLLAKAKARLTEAYTYHETRAKELCDNPNEYKSRTNDRQWYHECQMSLMNAFNNWLDSNINMYLKPGNVMMPFSDKFRLLLNGQNNMWMETIDHYQLNSFEPPFWSTIIVQNGDRPVNQPISSPPNIRGKTPDISPANRILTRLKTYEQPVMESKEYGKNNKLEPLVDPTISRDFYKVHTLMNEHLKYLEQCAKKYDNTCRDLSSIDGNLCDMIPILYEKVPFLKRKQKRCGEKCLGEANFVIKGEEWKMKENVNVNIGCNRKSHKAAVEQALTPYSDVAVHTSIITKLARLACDDKITNLNSNGVALFNTVLNAIKEENTLFPPANQVLVNVATQLGERFVTNNGEHCVRLLSKMKGTQNIGLVSTLLRPSQLSTPEMIRVYSAISTSMQDTHVAFSYLSKFRISNWLHDTRPTVTERIKFISLLCESLGTAGCELPQERQMLHELMCIHLCKVMAWEYPVHLGQVLTILCEMSLEKKLPPDTWHHCITLIETYPHLLSHQQARESMELVGRHWWSKRGTWGPNGLYGRYGIYCPHMARLGALLTSTVLNSAMLHHPPLLTKQICAIIMHAMLTFWSVWLCPWWGGTAHAPAWVEDLSRGPVLMPWGPDDHNPPDTMLSGLVETINYCISTLPGSRSELLSLTWQWYVNNFADQAVSVTVLTKVHVALAKLPWTTSPEHWLTLTDLESMKKVIGMKLQPCNNFILKCLGKRKWQCWLALQPPPLHSSIMHLLMPLLFNLSPDHQILDDAMHLPWGLISVETCEEIVNWFMTTQNFTLEPIHSNKLLPLLCAVGGLVPKSQCSEVWRNKRICLIRAWVNALSNTNSPSAAPGIRNLLNRIEETVMFLENATESGKCAEASHLLSAAVLMLNMMILMQVAQQEWLEWVKRTSELCLNSLIGNLVQVTQRDVFARLSEESLLCYFQRQGEWNWIINNWSGYCVVPTEYLIGTASLLTAMATYKSIDRSKYQGNSFYQVDKCILQHLHGFQIQCSYEKAACLWVCYMVSLIADASLDWSSAFAVMNQSSAILSKWSQDPNWGLLKAVGLVQRTEPTHRFRIITRFALCLVLANHRRVKELTPPNTITPSTNSYEEAVISLEKMGDQKQCADVKYIITKCLDFLQNHNKTINDSVKSITEVCSELYGDANYLNNLYELFDPTRPISYRNVH